MQMCPSGKGHQGQDIRPSAFKKDYYWAVAAEAGVIAHIGSYSVTLQTKDGTLYRYLHLNMKKLAVKPLEIVRVGQKIGLVSNDFGDSKTTLHLHFDVKTVVMIKGKPVALFVSPYTSLVESYKRLLLGEK
jgi:murein DD-endopeptidase MepM/ murein hydrolase activator NlpD